MSEQPADRQMGETFLAWRHCDRCGDAPQLHEFPVDRRVGFTRCTGCFTHSNLLSGGERRD